jgi:hypothetical protein
LPRLDGCTYKFFTKSCKNAAQFRDTGTWDDEVHAAFHGNLKKGEPTELCAVHLPLNQRKIWHGTKSETLACVKESYDYQFLNTDSREMAAQYMDTGKYTLRHLQSHVQSRKSLSYQSWISVFWHHKINHLSLERSRESRLRSATYTRLAERRITQCWSTGSAQGQRISTSHTLDGRTPSCIIKDNLIPRIHPLQNTIPNGSYIPD